MATIFTEKVRHGTPMPVVGAGSTGGGTVMFVFGYECQEVEACSSTNNVKKSTEFCLYGGDYWSASYKALPQKVNGNVKYQATFTKKPIIDLEPCTVAGGTCDDSIEL